MSLCVHHYYPLGSDNVGDALVAHAIRHAVTHHFGPAQFVDMPVNDRYPGNDRTLGLRGDNLDRSNAQADLVIVGGSNLLQPRSRGRWGVFTDINSIARLKKPLLLTGMGTGSDFGQRVQSLKAPALAEVRALHEKAFAASVRDQRTADALQRIGVQVRCTGCPVTFLTDAVVCRQPSDAPLFVSFPPPRIEKKRGGRGFMRQAMEYIAWLRDTGIPLVVTLHDRRDVEPARQRVPAGVETFFTLDVAQQIEQFRRCRGVIGFRLHAALLGLALGKPVVPVGVDWRGRGFVTTFGLENQSVRPFQWRPFARLQRLTDHLLAGDANMIEQQAEAKRRFGREHEGFWSEAVTTFHSQQ